jgi:hypothetical protein
MGEMGDPSVLLGHYDKLGGVKSRMQVRAEGNGVCYIVDDGVPDQLAVHVVLRHSILVKPVHFTARAKMRSFDTVFLATDYTVFLATDYACFVAAEYGSRERRGRRRCSQLVSVQCIVVGRRRARPTWRQIAVGKGPVGEVGIHGVFGIARGHVKVQHLVEDQVVVLQIQSVAAVARAAEVSIPGIAGNYGACDVSSSTVQATSDIVERVKCQEYVLAKLVGVPGMFEGDGVLRPTAAKAAERKSWLCWDRLSQDDTGRWSAPRWSCAHLLLIVYIVNCVLSRYVHCQTALAPLFVCRSSLPDPRFSRLGFL